MALRSPISFVLGCAISLAAPVAAEPGGDLDIARLKMASAATSQGDVFLRQGEYEKAEEAFIRAIDFEKRYAAAYLGLGATLVATQRFSTAIEVLVEAERRFVEWQDLHTMAGLLDRQHNKNREREVRDFAVQKRQSTPVSSAPTVEVALKQEIEAAERGRIVSDRLRPDLVDGIPAQVFYLEGIALLRLGRASDGIEALETALVLDGKHALAHYNLAVALFVRGELMPAKEHLDTAVERGAQPHPQFVADLDQALVESLN